jgi:enoyl-CoA hydratase
MTSLLKYEVQDAIVTITFNRPDVHNALNPEMLCRLVDALNAFDQDPRLRVAILTGAGTEAFCAGGDLGKTLPLLSGESKPIDKWDQRLLDDPTVRTISPLRDAPISKPVIAAVNGFCMAAGAEILLGTDIRIAAEHARFAWPEVRHALIPFAGTAVRLPSNIAYCQAMELLLTGDAIDAQTALRIGLVNHVVPGEQVLPKARKIAAKIAANGPIAVQEIKRMAIQSVGLSLEQKFLLEDKSYDTVMATGDAREGPRAFMEKRVAVYRGK